MGREVGQYLWLRFLNTKETKGRTRDTEEETDCVLCDSALQRLQAGSNELHIDRRGISLDIARDDRAGDLVILMNSRLA